MSNTDFRTIQSIGRDELIQELTEASTIEHNNVVKGIGDDAAVLKSTKDTFSLHTSETFMEGVDFDLSYMPLHHLGYKVLSASVSDVYAMNGKPDTALVNLAVPNKLSVDMLKQIYKGIYAAAEDYDVQIVGGDLTASHKTLSISISCTGTVPENRITYRSGARQDDAICVSGDLGGAIAGLRILMREKEFWQDSEEEAFQPDLEEYEYVVKRQLLPSARKDLIDLFYEHDITPTSMIDITQGLVSDLKQLTERSGFGSQIYQAALPIALETRTVADEMKEDVDKYALYGGEELELMFTMPEKQLNAFSELFGEVNVIGKMTGTGEKMKMQTADGDLVQFQKD